MLPKSLSNLQAPGLPQERVSKTFKIDHERGRVLSEKIDGREAVEQAIWVNLSIERNVWGIHTKEFGVEFSRLYGKDRDYARAMAEPIIRRALAWDERILSVGNFTITDLGKTGLMVDFEVETRAGLFETGVRINV